MKNRKEHNEEQKLTQRIEIDTQQSNKTLFFKSSKSKEISHKKQFTNKDNHFFVISLLVVDFMNIFRYFVVYQFQFFTVYQFISFIVGTHLKYYPVQVAADVHVALVCRCE